MARRIARLFHRSWWDEPNRLRLEWWGTEARAIEQAGDLADVLRNGHSCIREGRRTGFADMEPRELRPDECKACEVAFERYSARNQQSAFDPVATRAREIAVCVDAAERRRIVRNTSAQIWLALAREPTLTSRERALAAVRARRWAALEDETEWPGYNRVPRRRS